MTTYPQFQLEGRQFGISKTGQLVVMDPATGQTYAVSPPIIGVDLDLTASMAQLNLLSNVTDAEILAGGNGVTTATFNAVSTTSYAAVPGLSIPLVAGGTYIVEGHIFGAAGNAAGIGIEFGTADTLTVSSLRVTGTNKNGATGNVATTVTALGSDLSNFANTYTDVSFEGSLVVATAGTLIINAAQHSSSAATSTIAAGSYLRVIRK